MKKVIFLFDLCILFLFCACAKQVQMDHYQFYAMDTIIEVYFYNVENSLEISREIEKIYLKYDEVANDFQAGKNQKSVYDLNQMRSLEASDALLELITFGLEMEHLTDGYYQPFIGKLSHYWKDSLEQGKLVEEDIITRELEAIENTHLKIENHVVTIEGTADLDLGGIAKGYATNQVQDYLDSIDCHSFLLNAGNSTIVLGDKAGSDFKVGLSTAFTNEYYQILTLKDKAIGTSSIKEQHYFIDGKCYAHLLDAKTGKPADFYETFTIIGEDAGILDALSTACFSMELEQAKQFLSAHHFDFICSKNNQLYDQSEGVIAYEEA